MRYPLGARAASPPRQTWNARTISNVVALFQEGKIAEAVALHEEVKSFRLTVPRLWADPGPEVSGFGLARRRTLGEPSSTAFGPR